MKIRNSFYQQFLKCESNNSKELKFSLYKIYRNKIVELIKLCKKTYLCNYFYTNKNDMQKMWKGINELISGKSRKHNSTIFLNINDSITSNQQIICDTFNTYFL